MEHVVRRVCDKDPRCKAALALAGQRIQSFTCNILYESDGLNSDYDHVICGTGDTEQEAQESCTLNDVVLTRRVYLKGCN